MGSQRQRLKTITEEPTIYPNDTIIKKNIERMLQLDTVTKYDEDREYYWIDYENGDNAK